MRVLVVATKSPWPPRDGGRLLLLETLRSLAPLGHEVHLAAPVDCRPSEIEAIARELKGCCVPHLVRAPPHGIATSIARSLSRGMPLTIARHALAPLRSAVAVLLQTYDFDVVHAEQLQALSSCGAATERAIPVVLRAQNVESDLWAASGASSWRSPVFAWEADRLETWEGREVGQAALTLALSEQDATRLRQLSQGRGLVRVLAAPFPSATPAPPTELSGHPSVVLMGSGGWRPNQEGAAWFLKSVWPQVLKKIPTAEVHVFGSVTASGPGVHGHPAPLDSSSAFPAGSVLAVPLHKASGIRMKILEAWSRGVPVIATPQAAAGLVVTDGRELLLAPDVEAYVRAFSSLHEHPQLRHALVEGGRAALRKHHDPTRVGEELANAYAEAVRAVSRQSPG